MIDFRTGSARRRARTPLAALLLVGASIAAGRGLAQEWGEDPVPAKGGPVKLELRLAKGQRTTAESTTELTLELEYRSEGEGGGVFQREKRRLRESSIIHEWIAEMHEDGRAPKRAVRTYERLQAMLDTETRDSFGGAPQKGSNPVSDERARNIVVLEYAKDGRARIVEARADLVNPPTRAAVEDARETDLLPREPVAVGATWSVPKERIAVPGGGASLKSASLTVTLARLEAADPKSGAGEVAVLAFRGKAALEEAMLGSDRQVLTRATSEVDLEGEARFAVREGRYLDRTMKGKIARRETFVRVHEAEGLGVFEERTAFRYGRIVEDAPATPDEGPAGEVKEVYIAKIARVEDDHLVLKRGGDAGPRFVVFDPATKRIVKTLLVLPKSLGLDHPTLAPTRSKLAFSSNANNAISLAKWNVFAFDLATGKIDQLTPHYATGDGLAKPVGSEAAAAGKFGSIRGRIAWRDSRGIVRSDLVGAVELDGSDVPAIVDGRGEFSFAKVPATSFLLRVRGTGSDPSRNVPLEGYTVVLVNPGETADAGTITLHVPQVDFIFAYPSFCGAEIHGRVYGTETIFKCSHPERRYDDKIEMPGFLGVEGFSVSPDGKRFAVFSDSKTLFHDVATRKLERAAPHPQLAELKELSLHDIPFAAQSHIQSANRGAWLPDSSGVIYGGYVATPTLVPALIYARASDGATAIVKMWPEWARSGVFTDQIEDVAVSKDGTVGYFVRMTPLDEDGKRSRGELYSWDSTTDTTTRLTTLGDITRVTR